MSMSTSVRLSEPTKRRIKALARHNGCSEADVMRLALERGLTQLEQLLGPSPAEKD